MTESEFKTTLAAIYAAQNAAKAAEAEIERRLAAAWFASHPAEAAISRLIKARTPDDWGALRHEFWPT